MVSRWPGMHAITVPLCCTLRRAGGPRSLLPELGGDRKLLHVVEGWLRRERDARRARQAAAGGVSGGSGDVARGATPVVPSRTPLMPNKHLAFFR